MHSREVALIDTSSGRVRAWIGLIAPGEPSGRRSGQGAIRATISLSGSREMTQVSKVSDGARGPPEGHPGGGLQLRQLHLRLGSLRQGEQQRLRCAAPHCTAAVALSRCFASR